MSAEALPDIVEQFIDWNVARGSTDAEIEQELKALQLEIGWRSTLPFDHLTLRLRLCLLLRNRRLYDGGTLRLLRDDRLFQRSPKRSLEEGP